MKNQGKRIKSPASGVVLLTAVIVIVLAVALAWAISQESANRRTDIAVDQLVFSEICVKNDSIIASNDGGYHDYVELYNGGDEINLKGWYLTDGDSKSQPFGDFYVPAGSYSLLFLGKEITGFSLKSSGGESLALLNESGQVVIRANTVATEPDQVMLYAAAGYIVSKDASPGFPNTKEGLKAFRKGEQVEHTTLQISEVLLENVSALPDEQGRYCDVVELHNSGAAPVFLGSYCLSDSAENRFRYRLPGIWLGAGDYAVVYCDGENYIGQNGEIHANFGLSKDDALCLTDETGKYAVLPVQFPGPDTSLSRNAEGKYTAGAVSLGYANSDSGIDAFARSRMEQSAELVISEVLLSAANVPYRGVFVDVVEIWNPTDKTVSTTGWYLSDGSDPYTYPLPKQNVKPGERILLPCSRATTGFALAQGETVRLLSPNGKWASRVLCAEPLPGQSICLLDDVYTAGSVSLGYENTDQGVFSYEQNRTPKGLQISELMSANVSYIKGAYGKTWDWIELYNGGSESVNLKNYTFSKNAGKLNAYSLPNKTLAPGQYCVILLSDKFDSDPKDYNHLPVNLSSEGESVYLSCGGEVVDYAIVPALPTDISYGRAADGGGFSCLIPTPETANGERAAISANPQAVTAQGTYETNVQVILTGNGNIYYTTDCTEPTPESALYTGPISLTKTTVIRAVCYENGKIPSQIVDLTYLVNEGHRLPVVSLVTTPDNLWDYNTGIYVEGPNASPEFPYEGANYWQDWEKPATVSLFETDGTGFSEPCGISIHGAYSRALVMKGFALTFRDSYGAGSLDYPLFGPEGLNRFESFLLRCSGQDVFTSRMRDVLMTSLIGEHTTVAVQDYKPVVLYINGEFWGVYYIREKARESYVAGHYNVDQKDVILTGANGVDTPEYMDVLRYAYRQDLSKPEHYEYVTSQIDIENYIDYIAAEIYIANPDNGNIRYFKTVDGKWKWIMYDTDYGFTGAGHDTVWEHLNPAGTGSGDTFSTKLINGLLKNPDFKEQFIRRIAWQINNVWTEENVNARIDELESLIAHDMIRDCAKRWINYDTWKGHVSALRDFAPARNKQLPKLVQAYFSLTDEQMLQYGFVI